MQDQSGRMQAGENRNGTEATRKAAGGGRKGGEIPEWWQTVPACEKAVIRDVVASIRGLKRSKTPQISRAARKWERGIVCFIRFRLMSASGTGQRRPQKRRAAEGPMGRMGPMAGGARGA